MTMLRHNGKAGSGFTLVEIIVSLMIFSIVVVVALAALVKIIDANKKAQSIQDAVTNLSFSLDSMSRELRAGSSLYCSNGTTAKSPGQNNSSYSSTDTSGCQNGISGSRSDSTSWANSATFAFLSPNFDPGDKQCRLIYAYTIAPAVSPPDGTWTVNEAEQAGCGNSLSTPAPMVSTTSVTVNGFYVETNPQTDRDPMIFIELSGVTGNKLTTQTYFTVQTSASLRTPNS